MEVERLPGSLKQQCVARSQRGLPGIQFDAGPLGRDNDQIAAVGHHAGKDSAADQAGARRDDDFGKAGRLSE